jgi:hypothetical protein
MRQRTHTHETHLPDAAAQPLLRLHHQHVGEVLLEEVRGIQPGCASAYHYAGVVALHSRRHGGAAAAAAAPGHARLVLASRRPQQQPRLARTRPAKLKWRQQASCKCVVCAMNRTMHDCRLLHDV